MKIQDASTVTGGMVRYSTMRYGMVRNLRYRSKRMRIPIEKARGLGVVGMGSERQNAFGFMHAGAVLYPCRAI
jgi:hypothetical protein